MPGQKLPARVDRRPERLRDAQNDAARQCAPQIAQPADDHRLEAEDQPPAADRRVETGADTQQHPGNRGDRQRQRHRQPEDMRLVQPHQLGGVLIVGHGPKGAAQRGPVEGPLQAGNHRDGDAEGQQRQNTDSERTEADARGFQRTGVHFLRIGRIGFEQRVLDNHRQTESDQKRWQDVIAQRVIQHAALQNVAKTGHRRNHQDKRDQRMDTQHHRGRQPEIGRHHDQVAMGDVDQPHHAEDQAEPGREQRV